MNTPIIRHWIVSVARRAGLEGAQGLSLTSDTPIEDAWKTAASSAGITGADLARLVATHYRLPVADLQSVDPQSFRLIPAPVARALHVLPLRYSDRSLSVATADPVRLDAERELYRIAGRTVHFQVAPPEALASALASTYAADAGAAAPSEAVPADPVEKDGPRVLVIDDDPSARLLLQTVLSKEGFRVVDVSGGTEALEILGQDPESFDLVTLDLYMEKMQGLEVLKHIRSNVMTAGIPVVVATSSDDPAVEMRLFEAGADDFVVKPVDPPRFVLRLRAVLRRRASSQMGLPS